MAPQSSPHDAAVKGQATETGSAEASRTGSPTREHILLVASNLFAAQGYHGTTTREIADAVGIRQPSLFHHFESKAAIMEALLEEDLGRTVIDRERLSRADEPAAIRLYRYVYREVLHIAFSRYNVAGIYSEEVRTSPELEPWYTKRRRLHRAIDRIVRDGKSSGEFIDIETSLVRASILGTLERALTGYSGGKAEFDPATAHQIATLLLRSVLSDIDRLPGIQETVKSTEPDSPAATGTPSDTARSAQARLISDAAWQAIAPALPARLLGRGGQWSDDRRVLEAIAWRIVNASSWRDLPQRYGPWKTAWKRHKRWLEDGTWDAMRNLAHARSDIRSELHWLDDVLQ
jgi:AcrR family transcriptional regulator